MKQVALRAHDEQMISQDHQTKYTIYQKNQKKKTDEFLEILDMDASQRNSPNAFAQDVHNGDDLSIFLASN